MKLYARRPKKNQKQLAAVRINLTAANIFKSDGAAQIPDAAQPETAKQISEDGGKIREFLRKCLFDSYRDEYKEFIETIRGIEAKAQGAIAIAGIFIAGAFVFLRESGSPLLLTEKILLGLSIGFFVTSVYLSVRVLKVGDFYLPAAGVSINKMFIDCLRIEQESELFEEMNIFLTEQNTVWSRVKAANSEIINSKVEFLLAAQSYLQMAIVLIVILIMLRIFGH